MRASVEARRRFRRGRAYGRPRKMLPGGVHHRGPTGSRALRRNRSFSAAADRGIGKLLRAMHGNRAIDTGNRFNRRSEAKVAPSSPSPGTSFRGALRPRQELRGWYLNGAFGKRREDRKSRSALDAVQNAALPPPADL